MTLKRNQNFTIKNTCLNTRYVQKISIPIFLFFFLEKVFKKKYKMYLTIFLHKEASSTASEELFCQLLPTYQNILLRQHNASWRLYSLCLQGGEKIKIWGNQVRGLQLVLQNFPTKWVKERLGGWGYMRFRVPWVRSESPYVVRTCRNLLPTSFT